MALHAVKHFSVFISEAREAEAENDPEMAAELYERAIKQKPLEEEPYERLMVIYRKSRNYKDELRVIEKAIDIFIRHYEEKSTKIYGNNKKLEKAGKALLRSLTPKGSAAYFPQPIPKWQKRKETVEKKLKSKSN